MENSFFPVPQAVRSPCARRGRRRRGEYGGHLLTERAFFGSGLLVAQVRVRRVRTLLPRVRRVGVLPRQVQPRRGVHHDPAVQLRLGRDRGGVVGVGKVLLRVQVRKQHERLLCVGVLRVMNGRIGTGIKKERKLFSFKRICLGCMSSSPLTEAARSPYQALEIPL